MNNNSMDEQITLDQLVEAFRAGLTKPGDLSQPLDLLLAATGGNAIGMWRRVGDALRVLGFRRVAEFPDDVAVEFAAATEVVSLEKTGLGIVHATLTQQPAVALLPSQGGRLPGSGGWLERFGSVQSLSVPVLKDEEVIAVLALSTCFRFGEQDRTWMLTVALAKKLAEML